MNHFEETRKLLEHSQFYYIIATAMDGTYSYINSNYRNKFAWLQADLVGQPYYITMHEDDRQTCAEVAAKCFANPESLFPAMIRKHDGRGGYVFTQWEYKALFDEHNNPAGVFCLGYDITTFELDKLLLRQAETDSERKSVTLQKIAFQQSHMVRTPLCNIMGLAAVLEKSDGDNNVSTLCKMIVESAKKLDDVIRDVGGLAYGESETVVSQ